jgi:hypothetical protein
MSGGRPPPQHPGNAEVLVEIRPVNAHRHQFESPARRGAGVPQPWIPCQRSRDPAAIRERHHKLVGGEGNRDRPDIADINFQSAHAICLRGSALLFLHRLDDFHRLDTDAGNAPEKIYDLLFVIGQAIGVELCANGRVLGRLFLVLI